MEHENIEKIKERIAKLLRMAADSSSPNEAAIAAQRARSLMDKYQISEADLDNEIHDTFGKDRYGRNYKNVPTYMNILAVAVARFNDCRVIIDVDHNWRETNKGTKAARSGPNCNRFISFMGYSNDVVLAVAMMSSLVSFMDAACKTYLVKLGHTGAYPRGIGEAFKIGCSEELVSRIHAITRERNEMMEEQAKSSPGTAIAIIAKKMRVDEQFGEQKVKQSRHVAAYDHSTHHANEAGRREGRTMEIQRKVGEQ